MSWEDQIEAMAAERDAVYTERTRLIALLAGLCHTLGHRVGLGEHDPADQAWDKEWRTIVFIEIPNGVGGSFQASWHVSDRDRELVHHLPPYEKAWDGHTTAAKYAKIEKTAVWFGVCPGTAPSPMIYELLADMVMWGQEGDGVPDFCVGFTSAMAALGATMDGRGNEPSYKTPQAILDVIRSRGEARVAARRAKDAGGKTDMPNGCPGPDCPMCSGAVCAKCGAGACRNPVVDGLQCTHDGAERHEEP